MNVIAEIQRINERELELAVPFEASWHQKYKESAWVYVGGLAFELTEGDVLCVMSQFGEIEDINLVRDAKTGKSKGFAFIKYENWLSTVLAVDNMNGARLLERTIRVDHVLKYKLPKEVQDREDEKEAALLEASSDEDAEGKSDPKRMRGMPGHAYDGKELASGFDIGKGQNVFDAPEETKDEKKQRKKEEKKEKKAMKKMKKLEKKQAEWMEQVRLQRQARREQEERERAMQAEDGNAPVPSETGWRGRLEPTVHQPPPRRQNGEGDSADAYQERERKRRAVYGGINRTR